MTRNSFWVALALMSLTLAGALGAADLEAKTTAFHVEGMTCGLCGRAISKSVKSLEGVKDVSVDREEKRVEIAAESGVSAEVLEQAIESAGHFEAELIKGP